MQLPYKYIHFLCRQINSFLANFVSMHKTKVHNPCKMSVLLVRKPLFYVTDSSISYLAVLESPLSKQENKVNVLNTVTRALTQNLAPDCH